MATAIDFYESIHSYLTATYWVTDKTGPTINAKEPFKVRILVSNSAPKHHLVGGVPKIIFRNVKVRLYPHKSPSGDPFVELTKLGGLNATEIGNGQSIWADADLVAKQALSGDELETIATLVVVGGLNQDAFFKFKRLQPMSIDLDP